MAQTNPMKKNAACKIVFPIFDADGDLVSGATGLDSEYSLDGGSFSDCTNEATEIGSTGMYYLNLAAGETNGDVVVIQVKTTTSGAKTTALVFYTAYATDDEIFGWISTIYTAVSAIKTKTDALPSGITKGDALSKFPFMMVLSSDHLTPATGKTITATISKDGGSFASCANAPVEISGGFYYIDLTATEMTAKTIALKFTETNCDQRSITLVTSDIV